LLPHSAFRRKNVIETVRKGEVTMVRRLALSACFAAFAGAVAAVATEEKVGATYGECRVYNTSKTYLYGAPPTLLGQRYDFDLWAHDMNLHDCVSNLSQVRVKQWGNEVCDLYGGEYVTLSWGWQYTNFDRPIDNGNLFQQYDCDDVP
jgi:hypothetical protein